MAIKTVPTPKVAEVKTRQTDLLCYDNTVLIYYFLLLFPRHTPKIYCHQCKSICLLTTSRCMLKCSWLSYLGLYAVWPWRRRFSVPVQWRLSPCRQCAAEFPGYCRRLEGSEVSLSCTASFVKNLLSLITTYCLIYRTKPEQKINNKEQKITSG